MKPILSTEEVKKLEDIIEREGTSKAELMEHAGEFVASLALSYKPHDVVVLVGFGNNGGDGWVAADILQQHDISVTVVSPAERAETVSMPPSTAADATVSFIDEAETVLPFTVI